MSYTNIIKLGNGIVIPSSHDATSVGVITNPKLKEFIQNQAQKGYFYEGCGEDNCGQGEGREKSFLQSIEAETINRGSFDDLDLGYYNGYVLFSNIEANKQTLNKLLSVGGNTVKDVILNAAQQGIATQNNLPVSSIEKFKVLLDNNFTEEQLSADPTPENIIALLKDGENKMWSDYDLRSGGPKGTLAHYAKKGTQLRRANLKNKLSKGGVAFIGDGHIPELLSDFPNETQVIGDVTFVDDRLKEQISRIKQLIY